MQIRCLFRLISGIGVGAQSILGGGAQKLTYEWAVFDLVMGRFCPSRVDLFS